MQEYAHEMPRDIDNWARLGRPVPPPHQYKARVLLGCAHNRQLRTLVETGTYTGEMITSVAHAFDRVYSVELNEHLHREAIERYAKFEHLTLIQGDSTEVLAARSAKFLADGPALFWLDAHSPNECALIRELEALLPQDIDGCVILADDMRLMTYTTPDWPDVADILELVEDVKPGWKASVCADILLITPPEKETLGA